MGDTWSKERLPNYPGGLTPRNTVAKLIYQLDANHVDLQVHPTIKGKLRYMGLKKNKTGTEEKTQDMILPMINNRTLNNRWKWVRKWVSGEKTIEFKNKPFNKLLCGDWTPLVPTGEDCPREL